MTATWRPRTIAAHRLTVELYDGIDVTEADDVVVQRRDDGVIAIHTGAGMTLAWWRANFGERKLTFGAEAALTVCGHPATRQEVTVPAETATGIVANRNGGFGGHIYHSTPAQTQVALAGTAADGTPFVAIWQVNADRRDARRADEDHFLGSIRCD